MTCKRAERCPEYRIIPGSSKDPIKLMYTITEVRSEDDGGLLKGRPLSLLPTVSYSSRIPSGSSLSPLLHLRPPTRLPPTHLRPPNPDRFPGSPLRPYPRRTRVGSRGPVLHLWAGVRDGWWVAGSLQVGRVPVLAETSLPKFSFRCLPGVGRRSGH